MYVNIYTCGTYVATYVFYNCLYVYVGNIEKVSGVSVSCSPINLIVQCTTVWNVSIHM